MKNKEDQEKVSKKDILDFILKGCDFYHLYPNVVDITLLVDHLYEMRINKLKNSIPSKKKYNSRIVGSGSNFTIEEHLNDYQV